MISSKQKDSDRSIVNVLERAVEAKRSYWPYILDYIDCFIYRYNDIRNVTANVYQLKKKVNNNNTVVPGLIYSIEVA